MQTSAKKIPVNHSRRQGFTLVEVMVSIAILSMLAALAVPAFREISEKFSVSSVTDEMVAAINLTRNSAVQYNGNVVIIKLTEAETGLPSGTCNTNQNWSCGWRVFADTNGNAAWDAGETNIYTFSMSRNVVVMRSVTGVSMTANRWGQLSGINAVGFTLSPRGTGVSSPATTTICINSGGRVRTLPGQPAC